VKALATDLEFTLHATSGEQVVHVRLRRFGPRWVAQATGGSGRVGVGTSPRLALSAAIVPFGDTAAREMLADLSLLEPSVELVRQGSV
jgi:hypothetical protein